MDRAPREGFTRDSAGIREMLSSPMVEKGSLNAARAIERTARAIAPRDSGEYARSFQSRPLRVATLTARGGMEIRAGATVENTAPHAATVEFSRHVLTRAAKAIRT